jgi:hypothetical protein
MLARFKEVKWQPRVHIGDSKIAGSPSSRLVILLPVLVQKKNHQAPDIVRQIKSNTMDAKT